MYIRKETILFISFSCRVAISSLRLIPLSLSTLRYLPKSSSLFSSCKMSRILMNISSFGTNLYLSKIETSSSNESVKFFKQFKGKCESHSISYCNYVITLSRWNQLHTGLRTPPLTLVV